MDYLDPKKRLQHTVLLFTGYILVAVAITIGTLILLYQAYGFGLGKNGTIIQNGLLFFSSQPHPAQIYINGKLSKVQTNTRLTLPAGNYNVKLTLAGYRPWQRTIELEGGQVAHFDYPFLFPSKLTSNNLANYASAPALASQSPNRRWLVIQQPASETTFDVYDFNTPTKPPLQLVLNASSITKATSSNSWQAVSWADDNQHVLVQHNFDGKSEYVMLDRTSGDQAVNLTQTLALGQIPGSLTLLNKKADQFYWYNTQDHSLQTLSLSDTTFKPYLTHVLAYQEYGSSTMLYVTDAGAPAGKVLVKLRVDTTDYQIKTLPAGTTYPLNLTQYNGTLYVAVGAAGENRVYIYKDPVAQLSSNNNRAPAPAQVLHLTAPNYVSFSSNAQFVMAENGQQFGVYDIENLRGYLYTALRPLDSPQSHATWIDGDRLSYTSAGSVLVFDYDHTNQQQLVAADARFVPFFAPNYRYIYTLSEASGAAQATSETHLVQTSLVAK